MALPMLLCALLMASTAALPAGVVERVASRRIFFGHQSVGSNILDGLNDAASGRVPLREGRNRELLASPGLLHAAVGQNEAPSSKLVDFEASLEGLGGEVDIAFLKFCYVDFAGTTDAEKLFKEYRATLSRLQLKYPQVTFVHFTVPLTVVQEGVKAWLKKKVLGQEAWGAKENEVRHHFNTLLRRELAGQPLFDLAALESTRPDGTAATFELGGKTLPALAREYTDDGGHLNEVGRRRVAEALLTFLAGLP